MAVTLCPLPLILIIITLLLHAIQIFGSSEPESLLKFKDSLQNNNKIAIFSTWNPSTSPCSRDPSRPNWNGVLCTQQGKIWGLKLENMGLKGLIDVDALRQLPNLRTLSFMNNDFDSSWPELNKLHSLKSIYLSNNNFSGHIPAQTFQSMHSLKKIHLANNQFTGEIPSSLTMVPRLMELRLDGNQFTGRIPNFQHKNFISFSVANNQLHGQIPHMLTAMPSSSFSGNEGLCGGPLDACRSSKKLSIITIVVIAVVVGVAAIVIGTLIFIVLRRRKSKSGGEGGAATSVENPQSNHRKKARFKEAADEYSNQSTIMPAGRRGESTKLCFVRKDRQKFDLQELLRASADILGNGCFTSSYKAALLNGPVMVVKRFKQMNNVGREEFQEHMRRIGRLDHPNLLPLVAYYYRKEEKLLVTDYVEAGCLAAHLHEQQDVGQPEPGLDWPTRLKIIKGIAKGLEYLYKEMPRLMAPHGHLKSSNVLLTESFEPILNDYSLVPVMNQELAQDTMVVYKSPEYLRLGRITKKSDIWSLGMLILEILSGKQGGDMLNWVNSLSVVPGGEWIDKEMEGTKNSEGEMVKLLRIGLCCCEGDVDKRWNIKEAVEKIQELKERDHDDDFYSSYASEADMRSSRGLSDEINFSING